MTRQIGTYKIAKHDVLGDELTRDVSVGTVGGDTADS